MNTESYCATKLLRVTVPKRMPQEPLDRTLSLIVLLLTNSKPDGCPCARPRAIGVAP